MNKLKLFRRIYKYHRVGHRVTRESVNYMLNDYFLTDMALSLLFQECPAKFPGESRRDKYYLLNDFWAVLDELTIVFSLLSAHPTKLFVYIKGLVKYIVNLKKDREFYMDLSKIIKT